MAIGLLNYTFPTPGSKAAILHVQVTPEQKAMNERADVLEKTMIILRGLLQNPAFRAALQAGMPKYQSRSCITTHCM